MNRMPCKTEYKYPPVVVVGLNVTGLGVIRALAGLGIPLIGVDADLKSPASRTRYCRKKGVPSISDERLIPSLVELARHFREKPVLIPTEDLAVLQVSSHQKVLQNLYRFAYPDESTVSLLMNKEAFHDFALRHGFSVPQTFFVGSMEAMKGVGRRCRYPCVLKPVYRSELFNLHSSVKAFQCHDADSLMDRYALISRWGRDVVVQEFVPGPDSEVYFCLMVFDENSRCLASATGHKLRQWHPRTGSTSIAESIDAPEVRSEAIRLFEMVRFRGLGSVEFKKDMRDGSFKITEPTVGRPDWQSYLAVASGVNLPLAYYRSLISRPVKQEKQRFGVKWIHEENDIKSSLYYIRQRELTLSGWMKSVRRPRSFAFFRFNDPWPFLRMILNMAKKALASFPRPNRT